MATKLGIHIEEEGELDYERDSSPLPQSSDLKVQLLSTIRVPNNLKLLSDRLPKSKYTSDDHNPILVQDTTAPLVSSTKAGKITYNSVQEEALQKVLVRKANNLSTQNEVDSDRFHDIDIKESTSPLKQQVKKRVKGGKLKRNASQDAITPPTISKKTTETGSSSSPQGANHAGIILRDKTANDYLQTIRESGEGGPMKVITKGQKKQSPQRMETSSSLDDDQYSFDSHHTQDLSGQGGHSQSNKQLAVMP